MAYTFTKYNGFIQPTVSDEATPLCSFTVSDNIELSAIVAHVQKVGIHSTETLQLEIHLEETKDYPLIVSDIYTYDDFSMGSSHWAGLITFDFNRETLSSELTYWIKARVGNYVYSDDVRYIAFQIDFPEPINTPAITNQYAAGVGIYGYFD